MASTVAWAEAQASLDLGDLTAGRTASWRKAGVVREAAVEELPRERLLRHGPAVLSDAEVLALVLTRGDGDAAALRRADEILAAHRGLPGLVGADRSSLGHQGLSPAQSALLLASIELGRRLARADLPERYHFVRPAEVVRYLALRYSRHDQEVMGALYLDARNRLQTEREIFRGTINRAAVEPRQILREALLIGAVSVVLFHTHPSGNPDPSHEDVLFTKRLAEAAELLGVKLVDHVVLGAGGRWASLRDKLRW